MAIRCNPRVSTVHMLMTPSAPPAVSKYRPSWLGARADTCAQRDPVAPKSHTVNRCGSGSDTANRMYVVVDQERGAGTRSPHGDEQ